MTQQENMSRPKMEPAASGEDFKVLNVSAPAGAEMPEHHATTEAVICVQSGKAILSMGGKTHELTVGKSIILPANEDHSLKIEEEFKAHVVMKKEGEIKFD